MKKTAIILILVLTIYLKSFSQKKQANFIIFIADDVSFDDFGCTGNPDVETPNIDKLAENGMKFNNVYLTASSCSPSRNSIMTGRYPHNTDAAELHTQPPVEMLSFPELLKTKGYFTVQAGKFHMGEYAKRGFDVMITKKEENGDGGEKSWVKCVKERPKKQPFFMWFAAFDAHRAWGPNKFSGTHEVKNINPPFYMAQGEGTKSDFAKYYDEIKRFDHYIGEVVKTLKEQDVFDNTLIIVMADNGRPFPQSKTRVTDRGMKTPFIVSWPEKIIQKSECNSLVSVIDIAPTFLTLAEVEINEQFQGKSFAGLFAAPEQKFRNYIFAEHNWHDYEAHERMLRNENYMYIVNNRPNKPQLGPADAVGSPSYEELFALKESGQLTNIQSDVFIVPRPHEELYDCQEDPLQLLNVAAVPSYQKALGEMQAVMQQWIEETGDNVPDKLTRDWYEPVAGYKKTEFHGVRGEMPGKANNAAKINKPGPF
jgi:N-sulfoglucosamine sulfohydrolase